MKKLPIGIDIPEYISVCSLRPTASTHNKAVADLILIAFYFLLCVGEYTVTCNNKANSAIPAARRDFLCLHTTSSAASTNYHEMRRLT